jgi:superfamily II DNA or RNA helicase
MPYSKGGQTDVLNGQALCPDCNLRKGNKVVRKPGGVGAWPESVELRRWQHVAFSKYLECRERDFLAVATPGAGKTIFALRIAHYLLSTEKVSRVVIVCPSRHLKKQWADKAAEVGIDIDPDWSNSEQGESRDYHGIAITYQQVDSNPEIHRVHCRESTFVIFDEPHHMGESLSWGESIQTAFGPATQRLGITGTPFRTDNNPIPFIKYDKTGTSIADFTYGYGESLSDPGVCRAVLFPSYEGDIEWYSGPDKIKASFKDELSQVRQSERLNMALNTSGDWLNEVIVSADNRLAEIRATGHFDAGGLIICRDQKHAQRVGDRFRELIGVDPVIAVSDDKKASEKINGFRNGKQRWLIAVKMVSEGVDIPRLRVGVYATNVVTELFFRQAVGRFVRWIDGLETDDQAAYFFIPRDERLVSFAQKIKEERDHQLREEIEKIIRDRKKTDDKQMSLSVLISSMAFADDVIFDQDVFTPDSIQHAISIASEIGLPSTVDPVLLAKAFKLHEVRSNLLFSRNDSDKTRRPTPLYEQKKRRRGIISQLVRQIAAIKQRNGCDDDFSELCKSIFNDINQLGNEYISTEKATLDQLDDRIEYMSDWIRDLKKQYG